MQYDVVSGVSAGSFNTMGAALFEIGDEKGMVDWMIELWSTLKESDIIERYPEGIAKAIVNEPSAFMNKPLHDYMENVMKVYGPIKNRHVFWNAADANSGAYHQFTETVSDPVKALLSSGAMPFVWPA